MVQQQRLLELTGSFLLGGGIVALAYELAGLAPSTLADAASSRSPQDTSDTSWGDPSDIPLEAGSHGSPVPAGDPWRIPTENGHYQAFPPIFAATQALDGEAETMFPKHGVVTSLAVVLRERADLTSPILGVLRAGTRFRSDAERTFGGGCSQGWQHMHPQGWICREAGVSIAATPPEYKGPIVPAPRFDDPLPYEYYRIKDEATPFFHRLPSFGEQDRADLAGKAWIEKNGRVPMPTHPAQRPADVPAVVKDYQNAGYYVTVAGEEVKSQRRFARTLRGSYVRKYQLVKKTNPSFTGVLIPDPAMLPVYFITRELPLMRREQDGSDVLVKTEIIPERLSRYPFERKVFIGTKEHYENQDGLLMPTYAVAKVFAIRRPPGVGIDERWVHIDLSEQMLVAYDGDRPVFATLVSTGKQPGMTPVGVHRVQSKHIATSMRDQPPEEEAYSIEDVPWTQYFHNNVALHGAFWHTGFGLVRSHGCVNLSPADARWLFGFTEPILPSDWHSVTSAVEENGRGSPVVITE